MWGPGSHSFHTKETNIVRLLIIYLYYMMMPPRFFYRPERSICSISCELSWKLRTEPHWSSSGSTLCNFNFHVCYIWTTCSIDPRSPFLHARGCFSWLNNWSTSRLTSCNVISVRTYILHVSFLIIYNNLFCLLTTTKKQDMKE